MKQANINFIAELAVTNTPTFVIVKAIEELNELSTALAQHLTKPDKITEEEILREVADVHVQLLALRMHFNVTEDTIDEMVNEKIEKLKDYRKTVPNFGQL